VSRSAPWVRSLRSLCLPWLYRTYTHTHSLACAGEWDTPNIYILPISCFGKSHAHPTSPDVSCSFSGKDYRRGLYYYTSAALKKIYSCSWYDSRKCASNNPNMENSLANPIKSKLVVILTSGTQDRFRIYIATRPPRYCWIRPMDDQTKLNIWRFCGAHLNMKFTSIRVLDLFPLSAAVRIFTMMMADHGAEVIRPLTCWRWTSAKNWTATKTGGWVSVVSKCFQMVRKALNLNLKMSWVIAAFFKLCETHLSV